MRERIEAALRLGKNKADYVDLRVEDATNTWIWFRGPELDSIGSARSVGGIVRALYRGGWGYSTFNDLTDLEKRVEEACESARLVGQSTTHFAPVEPVVDQRQAALVKDFRTIPLAEKKAQVEEYNRILLGYSPKIQTSTTGYGDSFRRITFASSEGTYIEDEQPDIFIFGVAVAREGDLVQQAFQSEGGMEGYQHIESFHDKAEKAAQRAVELLTAPVVAGGKYTVVANPNLAGVFAHEAFGHLSEADFTYENPRMMEIMSLGKRFGPDMLNIIDDGALAGQLGTHRYDFEGTPTRPNYLIRDGILVGRLHSRETAGKMGEQPTGNARAIAYQHPPIVRMTNTYIDKGTSTFEEMIKDIPLGLYAVDMIGGQTSMEMFTFSAAYGYMIRDGQIAELVRDVTLTGNVFDTLQNIDMLGDRVEFAPGGPGGCGKGRQQGLRVGLGGPYTRIQNVVVGGQQ